MAVHAPARIRRGVAPRVPRRVSGPAHPAVSPPRPARQPRPAIAGRSATIPVGRIIAASQGRFIDRLVRGRLWIPTLGLLLMGIVFMQVSMLSMNAGIGRAVTQSSALERQNAALRAELSRMVINNSVSDSAAAVGMVVPAPGDYHVLNSGDGDAARRAANSLTDPIAPVRPAVVAPVATATTPVTPAVTPTQATPTQATPAQATPNQATPAPATSGAATATPAPQAGITSGGGTAAPGAQG